jgi:hypothetical protein
MLIMKSSMLVLAGLLGAGAVGGGMVSVMQPSNPIPARSTIASPAASPAARTIPAIVAAPDKPAPTTIKPASIDTPAPNRTTPAITEPAQAIRQVARCKVLMAIVKDSTPLNVRDQPSTDGAIVGTVTDGTFVNVKQEKSGWLEIAQPAGWIAKSKTASQCGQKVEQVSFGAGQTSATLSDEFLGAGNHQYKLALGQGQTLTITGAVGPLPAVIAPDGKYLIGMDEARGTWRTQLPSSGEYTFEMDSNFRGYKYDFAVEVQ